MRSSTSSSKALGWTLGFASLAGLLVGTDEALLRDQAAVMDTARRACRLEASETVAPHTPSGHQAAAAEVLRRNPAVLFVGNSVMLTATVPEDVAGAWHLDPNHVFAFGRPAAEPGVLLGALARSDLTPRMVVLDLSPVGMDADGDAGVFLEWARRAPQPGAGVAQAPGLEPRLRASLDSAFLLTTAHGAPTDHLRAVRDGLRWGRRAYGGAVLGNLTSVVGARGGQRVTLVNRTPGYARFRRLGIAALADLIRRRAERPTAWPGVREAARELASRGTRVVLTRMPLGPELRAVDDRELASSYEAIAAWADGQADVVFLDAGADPELAALPFYDGDHREWPVARAATRRLAAILTPLRPDDLR